MKPIKFTFFCLISFFLMYLFQDMKLVCVNLALLPLIARALSYGVDFLNLNFILGLLLISFGSIGYLVYNPNQMLVGTSLTYLLPVGYQFSTLSIFFLAGNVCILFSLYRSESKKLHFFAREWSLNPITELLMLVPGVGVVISGGITELFYRETHLYGNKYSVFTHIFSLLSITAPAIFTVAARASSSSQKFRYFLYVSFYVLLFFALGSRKFALGLVLLALIPEMKHSFSRLLQFILVFNCAFIGIAISLLLRGAQEQGLIPYLQFLSNFQFNEISFTPALGNITGGFPITGISAFLLHPYPLWHLAVELNPVWGGPAGWYRIAPLHSINSYTPSSGLGDLWNYGSVPFFVFWIAFNGFLTLIRRSYMLSSSPKVLLFSAYALAVVYFGSAVTQYSLRASIRGVYYVIFINLIILVATKFRERVNVIAS